MTDDHLVPRQIPRLFPSLSLVYLLGLIAPACLFSTSLSAESGELKESVFTFRSELETAVYAPSYAIVFSKHFTATAGYSLFSFNDTASSADIHYQGKLSNMQAMVNWHPLAGTLHFSAGAFVSSNKVTVSGKPIRNTFVDVGGMGDTTVQVGSFSSDAELPGNVEPYLGLGWSAKIQNGKICVFADFGVLFTSAVISRPTGAGSIVGEPLLRTNQGLAGNRGDSDLTPRRCTSLAQLGVMYRF